MTTILGLDLGIKTGSIIRAEIDPDHLVLRRHEALWDWSKGPSVKSPLDSIMAWFNKNVSWYLQHEISEYLAVDWNLKEVYWSANKHNSNVKTFMAGYLTSTAHHKGINVYFIPPEEVRLFFGMPRKLKKEVVQRHFLSIPRIYKGKLYHYRSDHELDAVILAYVLGLQMMGESCPPEFRYGQI